MNHINTKKKFTLHLIIELIIILLLLLTNLFPESGKLTFQFLNDASHLEAHLLVVTLELDHTLTGFGPLEVSSAPTIR
jgi:hypothetical protein